MKNILKFFIFLSIFSIFNLNCYSYFEIKMTDAISPFFDEKKDIKHYSNIPFYQIDLYDENLVDKKQLQDSKNRFIEYIKIIKDNGYNVISLDDLNHLAEFKKSGIYKNTQIGKRNNIYKKYYKELINIAKQNNIDVYITTDMQFYTDIILKKVGNIDSGIKNKKLLELNKEAIEELFTDLPLISGLIIRIGEGGKAYNFGDYKSKIVYKKPCEVNLLLKELLPIFEKFDKKLIFRTWSIGIGDIGDLIINKDTYDKTFLGIKSNNLIISIKHTPGDFFWFEKLNPTIGYGDLKQIVEIQVRREYEGGGDFPNYMGDYYKQIYDEIKNKKNVIGVWNWNQSGGWGWGKNVLFNFGFNFWNEINFFVVGQILRNEEINFDNILDRYGFSLEEKKVLKDILISSREIIKKGFYIDDFRKKELKIGGIFLPPLSWIWWDSTTSSPIILSLIYNLLDKKLDTIEESAFTLQKQKNQLENWKEVASNTDLNQKIYNSLLNRYKIFEINHLFKKAIIIYFQTGKKDYFDEISKKIYEYNNFIKDKDYINYDFSEIFNFYKGKTNIFYLCLNIFSFLILLFFVFKYKKIKAFYKSKFFNKILVISFLVFLISILTLTPFLFLSKYNFYWVWVKINYIIFPFIILYFILINYLIYRVFKIKIRLKYNFGKIMYGIVPLIVLLEVIIFISFIFGEEFFWNFISLGFFNFYVRGFIIILCIIYFMILVWYAMHFSNLLKYTRNLKVRNYFYVSLILFLFVFLFAILLFDQEKFFVRNIMYDLLPAYFKDAGTDLQEFLD